MEYNANFGLFHLEWQEVGEQSKICQVFMTFTPMD